MSKIIFLYTCATISAGALLFSGCSKNDVVSPVKKNIVLYKTDNPEDCSDQYIEEMINDYEKRIKWYYENKNYSAKNDSVVSLLIDQAVWLNEATLNSRYGDASKNFAVTEIFNDTFYITGVLKGVKYHVNENDVITMMNYMDAATQNHFNNSTLQDKFIVAIDLENLTSTQADLETKYFQVKMKVILAQSIVTIPQPQCSFGSTDYWFYWAKHNAWFYGGSLCQGGKCGSYSGTSNPCSDAAEEIQKKVNICLAKCKGYYTSIGNYMQGPWVSPGVPSGLLFLWGCNPPLPGELCLSPYDMNIYKNGAVTIAGTVPVNKSTISVDLEGFAGSDYDCYMYGGHIITVTYGTCQKGINPK